jgi:hypothetical protein
MLWAGSVEMSKTLSRLLERRAAKLQLRGGEGRDGRRKRGGREGREGRGRS